MIFLLHYIQLSLWTFIYLYQKNKSPIIYDLIIKKIKDSGCIAIKFTQWLIPILEAEYEMDSERLREIEELYENCHGESVGYMKQIYKQAKFNERENLWEIGQIDYALNKKVYGKKIRQPQQSFIADVGLMDRPKRTTIDYKLSHNNSYKTNQRLHLDKMERLMR